MAKRNVTLVIDEDVLREARHLAVERGLSLSAFLAEILTERAHRLRATRDAWQRAKALLSTGLNLGTEGRPQATREELYER